jgi:hypothetical protein
MGVTIVSFSVHLPKHARKGHQAFLPRDDGTLSAIKLPLPGKEPPHAKETKAYTNQKLKADITTKKPNERRHPSLCDRMATGGDRVGGSRYGNVYHCHPH